MKRNSAKGGNKMCMNEISSNLEHLKALTGKLKNFSDLVKERELDDRDKLSIVLSDTGYTGWRLITEKGCIIHKWFNRKGTVLSLSTSEWTEIYIIYEGIAELKIGEEQTTFQRANSFNIPPNTMYTVTYPYDTWVLVITIPSNS